MGAVGSARTDRDARWVSGANQIQLYTGAAARPTPNWMGCAELGSGPRFASGPLGRPAISSLARVGADSFAHGSKRWAAANRRHKPKKKKGQRRRENRKKENPGRAAVLTQKNAH